VGRGHSCPRALEADPVIPICDSGPFGGAPAPGMGPTASRTRVSAPHNLRLDREHRPYIVCPAEPGCAKQDAGGIQGHCLWS
jgi:hypothetical protein